MMPPDAIAALLPPQRQQVRRWGESYIRRRDLCKLGIPHPGEAGDRLPSFLIVMELAKHVAAMDWARDAKHWWYCTLRHIALKDALAGEKAIIEKMERRRRQLVAIGRPSNDT
jgi:hypothetical protein